MKGVGDRYRWAWKGSDFTNGTFQGAAHGLASLVANNLLPENIPHAVIVKRIEDMISGVGNITRSNGSLDEIMPFESSYCVTALVAFDILSALRLLKRHMTTSRWVEHHATVRPLINFILHSRESHGIISNHLAAGAAALALWKTATGDDVNSALVSTISLIEEHYSPEGWFLEYEGPDPGYQSLALDYLTVLNELAPEHHLSPLLSQAANFLTYMAHPDGSFGGLYGSRNTRFLYPAGIETLASSSEAATSLAAFSRKAHLKNSVVGLLAMDEANLIPMFNSFCRASALEKPILGAPLLPCHSRPFTKTFPDAGLIVHRTQTNYSIVNWRKGGAFYSTSAGSDGGSLAIDSRGKYYTTQISRKNSQIISQDTNSVLIEAPLLRYKMLYPSPISMILLRGLCLTAMRIKFLNGLIKKLLVLLLIKRTTREAGRCRRHIQFEPFTVKDSLVENDIGLELLPLQSFYAVHMASQGYWQSGDKS
ncbi:hypothetical protein N9V98_03220 [Luminiphilus sp.]|nr:hypothetical protein [Luminiphilus sp.]